MPPTISGAALSILLGMSLIVGGWGGYWRYTGNRARGMVMITIGVVVLVGSVVGLVWLRAPFITQAAVVTLIVGVVATAAEVWVRKQRAPVALRQPNAPPTAPEPAPVARRAAVRHTGPKRPTQSRQPAADGRARSRQRP